MADNIALASGEVTATDDIAGVHSPRVKLQIGADGTAVDVQPPDADAKAVTALLSAGGMLYNGATWDRERGNFTSTLLASAARTATTGSAAQTNYNHLGVILQLNVTGVGTTNLIVRVIDAGNSSFILAAFAAVTATTSFIYYPGVTSADLSAPAKSGVLPRSWAATVVHGDSSSWTYALSASVIL